MSPDDVVESLARLVGFPTVAGEPNGALIGYVAERLSARGASVRILPGPRPEALNLHAVLGPPDEPGGVMLCAHSDVVSAEGQPWTCDPFVLHPDGHRLYGRGTADMKGFLAAVLDAVDSAEPAQLRRPLHVAVSSDEELGCKGAGPLIDSIAALPVRPARALVGEPTELQVATRHKGKTAFRVELRGRAAHSSVAGDGVNAVACAGRLIVELLELQDEVAAEYCDPAFAVPHASVGIGPVAGGVSVNIVPDRCSLDVELRHLPGQEPSTLTARVRRAAARLEREMRDRAPEAAIAFEELSSYPALAPGVDDGFAADVGMRTGRPRPIAVDFGTEAGMYQQRLGIPVVVCGPGRMAQAHKADEYVERDQVVRARRLVGQLIAGLTR